MGGAISESTLPRLTCEVIAGSANNQIDGTSVPSVLLERGILYAPDYVINAGGLINVYVELHGYDRTRALTLTREIYGRLRKVFTVARELGIPTSTAADRIVEQRLTQERQQRIMVNEADSTSRQAARVPTGVLPAHSLADSAHPPTSRPGPMRLIKRNGAGPASRRGRKFHETAKYP